MLEAREEEKKVVAARHKMRELEDTAVMKSEMATYTPAMLGHNASNPYAKIYRERRHIVLDKLAKLGQGLSPAQKVDFPWFKDAWDSAMVDSHGELWGELFAMQMQKILDDISSGVTNSFSEMIYSETNRMLHEPALRL